MIVRDELGKYENQHYENQLISRLDLMTRLDVRTGNVRSEDMR